MLTPRACALQITALQKKLEEAQNRKIPACFPK